jgi:hypothetical protein
MLASPFPVQVPKHDGRKNAHNCNACKQSQDGFHN